MGIKISDKKIKEIRMNLRENKMFWRDISVRKEKEKICQFIKDRDSELVKGREEVRSNLLNFRDDREPELPRER